MRFSETELPGVFVIDLERIEDERGFFARSWDAEEFVRHGLDARLVACNISYNKRRGTLRGMHFQSAPHGECKLVRCTRGALYDVAVDLRPSSVGFCRWVAVELTADNRRMLFVPPDVAHGFQTLSDDSEVFYQMSCPYEPTAARGVRWDDPAFGIRWPDAERVITARDRAFADFERVPS
jgi:dTDP-4-dehydrorhamnose 3,5-epimerase